jgi:hypothetical protein
MIAFAVMLLAAAVSGWSLVAAMPPLARAYARFACVLYAALAAAIAVDARLAYSVALIVSAVAPALLALAIANVLRKPIATAFASLVMAAFCIAGMAAAVTGIAALAFGPLLLSIVAMIALTLQEWRIDRLATIQSIASAGALLAGASAFVDGSMVGFCAFAAAGLLGAALSMTRRSDVVVEEDGERNPRSTNAIRSLR